MTERDPDVRAQSEDALHQRALALGAANDFAAHHLDTLPNVVFEVGAVLVRVSEQQAHGATTSVKYQDRVIFQDTYEPTEYPCCCARVRDPGRVLRLLPRLPRIRTLWNQSARRCASGTTALAKRTARDPRPAEDRLPVASSACSRTITFSTVRR